MNFEMIVAADQLWGIGKVNGMPWPRLKSDLQNFKKITTTASEGLRNAIVMGRKTWESIGSKPLPGRLNVIVTRNKGLVEIPGGESVLWVTSLQEAFNACEFKQRAQTLAEHSVPATIDKVFVIGGGEIYRQVLEERFEGHSLTKIHLTKIYGEYDCDVTIPSLFEDGWAMVGTVAGFYQEENGVKFSMVTLQKPKGTLNKNQEAFLTTVVPADTSTPPGVDLSEVETE